MQQNGQRVISPAWRPNAKARGASPTQWLAERERGDARSAFGLNAERGSVRT
jgi:hypothetical protein